MIKLIKDVYREFLTYHAKYRIEEKSVSVVVSYPPNKFDRDITCDKLWLDFFRKYTISRK